MPAQPAPSDEATLAALNAGVRAPHPVPCVLLAKGRHPARSSPLSVAKGSRPGSSPSGKTAAARKKGTSAGWRRID